MDIAVVGGGISGLSTAYRLTKDGHHVTLFEASNHVGGKIGTVYSEGLELDLGPITVAETPALRDLADELNLEIVEASDASKTRYIYSNGSLHLVGPKMIVGSLLSWGGKFSMLRFLFTKKKDEDESVASYATRRFGEEASRRLFNPLMNGIYACDSELLSANTVIKKRKTGSKRKIISLKGGIASLTNALASRLGNSIRINTAIEDLRQLDAFQEVYFTTPAFVTAELIRKLDNDLANKLSAIRYSSLSQLFIETVPGAIKFDGFGFLVPGEERMSLLGAVCISNILPSKVTDDRRVFVLFCRGDNTGDAINEFKNILQPAIIKVIHTQSYKNSIPQFHVGYQQVLDQIRQFEQQNPKYRIRGNFVTGVAVSDCI